jgi:hypothetical protein
MRVDLSKSRSKGRTAIVAVALFVLFGWTFTARPGLPQQRQGPGTIPSQTPNSPFPPEAEPGNEPGTVDEQRNPMLAQMRKRQAAQRNAQRQKEMVSDTNKLLALAAQLKQEAAKNGQEGPAPDVSKEADQIEKLAKSVRDKMKAF